MTAPKAKKVKALTLQEWIDKESIQTVASVLRLERSTVRHWRRGCVLPKDDVKLKIMKLSRGAVSADRMIKLHYSPTNKNRWT